MADIGFPFLDRPGVAEQLRLAKKAEALGYASLWVTETRLARDAISILGAMAATVPRQPQLDCLLSTIFMDSILRIHH